MYKLIHCYVHSGEFYVNQENMFSTLQKITCYVLDTNDMVVEAFDKDGIINLIKTLPDIKISGISHKDGVINRIYVPRFSEYNIAGAYGVYSEQFVNRGEFSKIKIYKKGEGLVRTFSTPHTTNLKWYLDGVDLDGKYMIIHFSLEDKRNTHKLDFKLDTENKCSDVKVYTQQQVDKMF